MQQCFPKPPALSKPILPNGALPHPPPHKNETHPFEKPPPPPLPPHISIETFIFSKFAGLPAYNRQLYYQINSTRGIFNRVLSPPPMLPPCIELSPPRPSQILKRIPPPHHGGLPHVLNTCGKSWVCCAGAVGSLKSKWKQTGGGEESNLSPCSLCEKLPDFSNSKQSSF